MIKPVACLLLYIILACNILPLEVATVKEVSIAVRAVELVEGIGYMLPQDPACNPGKARSSNKLTLSNNQWRHRGNSLSSSQFHDHW